MRSQEFTGKTTQEAIDTGLAALGVTIADVHVDVIQEGAKGLFGLFGSKPACVRLTVMEDEQEDDHGLSDLLGSFSLSDPAARRKQSKPQKPETKREAPKAEPKQETPKVEGKKEAPKAEVKKEAPKAEAKVAAPQAEAKKEAPAKPAQSETVKEEAQTAPKAEAKKERVPKQPRPAKQPRAPKSAATETQEKEHVPMTPAQTFNPTEPPVIHDESTPAGRAQRFLMDVTERMNVSVQVYVDDSKEDNLYIHMIGDTLGILIGRRGETLDALQYLTSLQVNKGREGYIRVTLDTENYRAKREDSLRRLAQRMANRAQKTGRKVVLEPMNPYERRVLHTALQNHPAVTTHSEGEEPNRRVVIMLAGQPEKAEQGEKNGDQPSAARRNRNRRRGRRGPKKDAAQNAPQTENVQENAAPVAETGSEE